MEGDDELAGTPAEDTTTPTPEKVEGQEGGTAVKPESGEAGEAGTATLAEGEEGEGEQPDQTEEERRKRPSGSERLKRRLSLIETDYDRLQRENEELKRAALPSTEGKPGVDREPTEADYPNDYFAFERAKTVWDTRQAVREEMNRERQGRQANVQRELQAERIEAWEENKALARERIPDFDKVVSEAGRAIQVKPEVAEELLASDKSALLQYHLAKNPEKVRDLNQMSGRELAREIGRLEARVHLPSPKKATEAPPPPSQVRGKAAPPVNLASADMDTYVALRKKQGF
jgi:hypothetical protein